MEDIEEIWLPFKYEGYEKYKVSNFGRFKSPSGRLIRGHQEPKGYIRIKTSQKGEVLRKYAHVIVAEHFVVNPNPELYDQVDHKNHKRDDNHYLNLRWSNHHLNQLNRRDRINAETSMEAV